MLGKWEAKTPKPGTQHVTIAVSGYDGGKTIDFRKFAHNGITLLGMTKKFESGKLYFEDDLKTNIEHGDRNYLDLLDEADEYIKKIIFLFLKNQKQEILFLIIRVLQNHFRIRFRRIRHYISNLGDRLQT